MGIKNVGERQRKKRKVLSEEEKLQRKKERKFKTLNSRHTFNIIIRVRKERVSFIILCLKNSVKKLNYGFYFIKLICEFCPGLGIPFRISYRDVRGSYWQTKSKTIMFVFVLGKVDSRKQIDWKRIRRTIEMWISVEVFLHTTMYTFTCNKLNV